MGQRLRLSLFLLRLGVFILMFFWTIDKLLRPDHASAVFQHFYFLPQIGGSIIMAIGVFELIVILFFLLGMYKRYSYGFVLIVHTISTLSSYKQYLAPFDKTNLLFFAAWPMLAACVALFLLRKEDTMFTLKLFSN